MAADCRPPTRVDEGSVNLSRGYTVPFIRIGFYIVVRRQGGLKNSAHTVYCVCLSFFLNEFINSRAPRNIKKTANIFRKTSCGTRGDRLAPSAANGTAPSIIKRATFLFISLFFRWVKIEASPMGRKKIRLIPCALS